ncbi:hypothetical protein EDEG_01379 [Edhazardia aedis USNM 41457]|uniref:Ricin B lectin domain-containing protein n=1 Tax=Edhazardia aedis (strain USNM 41457) TaxID=1003232 RepID=J8ZXG7_EDHAE|nr:hypothetical protein EDEG_01379 [Edhazardia aedis USNM 41457]|eukprot:EJW04378.1 hypothetical protein EDEG_01379 [Edhazardia aedis USNM 41457]
MLFYISMVSAYTFLIKQAYTDTYIGDFETHLTFPKLTNRSGACIFKIKVDECDPREKIFYVDDIDKTSLDYDEHSNKLVYFSGKPGSSQKFEIIPVDLDNRVIMIAQGQQCLTYDEVENFFYKTKCDSQKRQQMFQMIELRPEIIHEHHVIPDIHYDESTCRTPFAFRENECNIREHDDLHHEMVHSVYPYSLKDRLSACATSLSAAARDQLLHRTPEVKLKSPVLREVYRSMRNSLR